MKKFYAREKEQAAILSELQLVKETGSARMAVITGRRRVGKTQLILKTLRGRDEPLVYLFAARMTREALVRAWVKEAAEKLGIAFPPRLERLSEVILWLLSLSRSRTFCVAIDECQDIDLAEPSFWSELQRDWDLSRESSRMLLLMSGSVASAMRRIFSDMSEPLYGRVNSFITVRPFGVRTLREILSDYSGKAQPESLLALYALTGGVPWFVEDLADHGATDLERMAERAFCPSSIFLTDGDILIATEFKAEAVTARTILAGLASGVTKREELQNLVPGASISGALSKLEKFFGLITPSAPIFETNYRKVRYTLSDCYLKFWFLFVEKEAFAREMQDYGGMRERFLAGYPAYSGRVLEQLFAELFKEERRYSRVGRWWDRKGENEIDLIGIDDRNKTVDIFEIKRNPKKISLELLQKKADAFLSQNAGQLKGYEPRLRGLSLEDLA